MTDKVEIGLATLYNGDCAEVSQILEAKSVDHTITDPPYEAEAHSNQRQVYSAGGGLKDGTLNFEAMNVDLRNMIATQITRVTREWALIFCQLEGWHKWREVFLAHGATPDHPMIWSKPDGKPRFDGTGPAPSYEVIELLFCGDGRRSWNGGGARGVFTENWNEKRDEGNMHQTIKPQKLMRKLVQFFTNPGQVIFDPFMGSGSTGVAAVAEGRKFIGVERNSEYFEICCKRIENEQKGDLVTSSVYVKTKAKVTVPLFETPVKKVAAPKPRGVVVKTAPVVKAASKARFSIPIISTESKPVVTKTTIPWVNPFFELYRPRVEAAQGEVIQFDIWDGSGKNHLAVDVESYYNFFLICFLDLRSGKKYSFERSDRTDFDPKFVRSIIETNRIISFNGLVYDMPMIYLALKGATPHELKTATNRIISSGMKSWQVERELGIKIGPVDHIDLFEPNPAVRTGLKVLGARLNGRFVVDLPYEPEKILTRDEMNYTTFYCFNDLDETKGIYTAMAEPLELRRNLSNEYKQDLRSKSDAQVGEAIIRKRIGTVGKAATMGSFFNYTVPPFIHFTSSTMKDIVKKLGESDFSINEFGKVAGPTWLEDTKVTYGSTTYNMGIGGLHSTEENRAVHSDDENDLEDIDVTGQYPNIIVKLGIYPKGAGPKFTEVFDAIIKERAAAKKEWQRLDKLIEANPSDELKAEREPWKVKTEGLKIANNGAYGKTGSQYSFLYAPDLMIATTITGQLSLLMLIERFERAGIPVISGNTDGVVARCPKDLRDEMDAIVAEWENDTSFSVERNKYKSIYNSSVNSYIAIKENGKAKVKGPLADPWAENDIRGMMMKNPQMTVCTAALLAYIKDGTPFEETIKACKDPRKFITVIKVDVGAKWREHKIGRVVRWYWSTDGDPILYVKSNRKVAKTAGARPLVELTDSLPADIDFDRYVEETEKLANDYAIINKGKLI